MRRLIACALALFLLLLCGCTSTSENLTADVDAASAETNIASTPIIQRPLEENQLFFFVPKYYGTLLTEFSSSCKLEFYILSSQQLQTEQIVVNTGLQAQGEISITQSRLQGLVLQDGDDVTSEDTCPLFVYQCYQVQDWAPFQNMEAAYAAANAEDRPEIQKQIVSLWQSSLQSRISPDTWNKAHALPFFLYHVNIFLTGQAEKPEHIQNITVAVDGIPHELAIGDLTVDSRNLFGTDGFLIDWDSCLEIASGITYTNGYSRGWFAPNVYSSEYQALEDLIVKDITPAIDDVDLRVEQIEITVTDPKGLEVSFLWDGETPFSVPAGSTFTITPTCYSEHLDASSYCADAYLRINCQTESGKLCQLICCVAVRAIPNPYAFYAEEVDGIDMEAYYHNVFFPTQGGLAAEHYYGD